VVCGHTYSQPDPLKTNSALFHVFDRSGAQAPYYLHPVRPSAILSAKDLSNYVHRLTRSCTLPCGARDTAVPLFLKAIGRLPDGAPTAGERSIDRFGAQTTLFGLETVAAASKISPHCK